MADETQSEQHKKVSPIRKLASHASAKHLRPKELVTPPKPIEAGPTPPAQKQGFWRRLFGKKKVSIPLGIIVLLAVIAAVPATRYPVLGLFMKKNYAVTILDSDTQKPVSGATVTLDGHTVTTNNEGVARLDVKVGHGTLAISKTYYKDTSEGVFVGLKAQEEPALLHLVATGRQVPITILNTITGKPVANATIASKGAEDKTDAKGQVTMVLPADASAASAVLSGSGYNNANVTITITANTVPANTFKITPSGSVYFLSDASGTVDVVKTNLDGTNRQTVAAGTGNEDPNNTQLMESSDGKYLALDSIRSSSGNTELNLIEVTNNDKMVNIDSGSNATFTAIGWAGDTFVYQVNRLNVQMWQAGEYSLKSYDAATGTITTLDSSDGIGVANDPIGDKFDAYAIVGNQLLYAKTWYYNDFYTSLGNQQNTLNVINVDGSDKKTLGSYASTNERVANILLTTPNQALISIYAAANQSNIYYTYNSDGTYAQNNNPGTSQSLQYFISPSGNQTFWSAYRDGQNVLLVGDQNGQDGKEVTTPSGYFAYGWATNNYLLVGKSSALYIVSVNGGTPLKVTDFLY